MTTPMPNGTDSTAATIDSRGKLMSPGFWGLLLTGLLGATNDNIFRWLVIGIGKQYVTPDNIRFVLMAGSVSFVLPYLFLAAHAGYLADRFSKRNVIIVLKGAEIFIMALGVSAILLGSLPLLLFTVALMGAQSALMGPSRLGAIPEIVRVDRISAANGIIGLATVVATVLGMAIGCWLTDVTGDFGRPGWWLSALVLLGVAGAGWAASFLIKRLVAADSTRRFPSNPWQLVQDTFRDLKTLASNRALLRVALGITFFWSLGAMAQLNIDQFAFEGGATIQQEVIPLLVSLVIGVGMGCILAGVWSAGRVELGILPLGALGIMVSSLLLFTVQGVLVDPQRGFTFSYMAACVILFALGVSSGLFDVPLQAYIQHRSPPQERGTILAATQFLTFAAMLAVFVLYSFLRTPYHEGNFANLAIPALSATEQAEVAQTTREFKQQQASGDSPKIEPLIAETTGDFRQALLSNLLWAEISNQRQRGAPLSYEAFQERFPDDQHLVKNVYNQVVGLPLFSSAQIFLLCSLLTVPVFIYIVWLIPQAAIRFIVWLASITFYRIRVEGRENLPERGGALLVPNHVSWLDGILLMLISSRPLRMVVYGGNFKNRVLLWMAKLHGTIFLEPSPKAIARALQEARAALSNGELVCVFPEGGISRNGQLQPFKPGIMKILKGTTAPVVPIYLDELWGSIFSFERGRFFWKWPKRIPYPITIHIGPPIEQPDDIHGIRQSVAQLGATAVQERTQRTPNLPARFIRYCKRRKFRSKIADSAGADLTGGQLLMRTLVLRRLLNRHVLAPDEKHVGVLLPPVAGAIVTNMALAIDRRVSVNLNYTFSSETLNYCIERCGIRHVLTSRKFMEKMDFSLNAEIVYLEDFKDKVTTGDKISSVMAAYLTPSGLLQRQLGLHTIKADDVLTIIFTSGSTGTPKGVMLTYGNVGSNVEAVDQIVQLAKDDVFVGILPLFHSFGYTVSMWCACGLDMKGAYHFSPLDAKIIGKLCREHRGTILLATPTFLRTYLRRCDPADFATLNVVVAGAEKLPKDLIDAFEEKFKVRPVEGYGATELSPLVSVNVPPSRTVFSGQKVLKEGSVGLPIPGVTAKIVHLETGEELGIDQPGMLWIKGPNVMKGYFEQPEKTAEVIRDGWYVTGDVAMLDEDGFITITGRESRFSKIGGEMVPHIQVEETLAKLVAAEDDEHLRVAVTAVPDDKRGERLIVVHTKLEQSPADLCNALRNAGLPNLFIPSADSFIEVDALPVLGTGKLDLKAVKELALGHFAAAN